MSRIYLSPPDMGGTEQNLVAEAFASNWIAPLGPFVDRFEQDLGHYHGDLSVCALASGTAALHLGLILLGVQPGDRVYCSDFTFSATANVIHYCGAQPVFIDSNEETWNMDPELLADALEHDAARGRLPRAVIVVDLYGISADFPKIEAICSKFEIPVLEDSAEALGSRCNGRLCGTFGAFSALSFNGNKIITTSGGGALLSRDVDAIKRARFFATQAREPRPYYHHEHIGYNYRLSNILAAVGCGQMQHLNEHIAKRRHVNASYRAELASIPGISFMPEPAGWESNCWLSVIQIDPQIIRKSSEELRQQLETANIETRPVWKPMHMQPVFADCKCHGGSVGARIFERGLCLPSGSSLGGAEQEFVVEHLKKALSA